MHLVVVERPELALYARLRAKPWESVTVIWDRRQGERWTTGLPVAVDRRRRDRRRPPPETWGVVGFVMVRRQDRPP